MAKIDVSKIEGYEQMTPEQKLAALEGFEYEDNASELERHKAALSKANSEAAEWKRKHNALISEDEKKKQEDSDRFTQMEKELADLRKDKAVSENKAKLIAQGYSETLAEETAQAMAEGDNAKVFANMQKFLTEHDKALKTEMLKNTPTPPPGKPGAGMTREQIMEIKDSVERQNAIAANIELFRKE